MSLVVVSACPIRSCLSQEMLCRAIVESVGQANAGARKDRASYCACSNSTRLATIDPLCVAGLRRRSTPHGGGRQHFLVVARYAELVWDRGSRWIVARLHGTPSEACQQELRVLVRGFPAAARAGMGHICANGPDAGTQFVHGARTFNRDGPAQARKQLARGDVATVRA